MKEDSAQFFNYKMCSYCFYFDVNVDDSTGWCDEKELYVKWSSYCPRWKYKEFKEDKKT